jgi:hypothetical protein
MPANDVNPMLAALRGLEESYDKHIRAQAQQADEAVEQISRPPPKPKRRVYDFGVIASALRASNEIPYLHLLTHLRHLRRLGVLGPHLRRAALVLGGLVVVGALGFGVLWWRLSSGPISLDIATPWITSAIEQNFGARHKVEIGGTILERDEQGRTAVRIRDIVVREPDGKIVAKAPRAEVGLSHASLLSGKPRAESLNLVGAQISVRIGTDGQLTLLTNQPPGAPGTSPSAAPDKQDVQVTPATSSAVLSHPASKTFLRDAPKNFAALLAWIDSLSALGLDGYDLNEIGLKNGRVIVDDQRNGQQSIFENISLSLTRPRAGEVVFSIGSEQAERPWLLLAGVTSLGGGKRGISIEARKIALRDVLLALRVGDGQIDADIPFSAAVRAEIQQDGTPLAASGRMLIGPGFIGAGGDDGDRIKIDRAELSLEWDSSRRAVTIPFQIVSGGTRLTLAAFAEAPKQPGGVWPLALSGGSIVIAPKDVAADQHILLNRIAVRGRFDPVKQRIEFEHGDLAGKGIGLALSGNLDFSGSEPRLAVGLAAQSMPVSAFKLLWPALVNPPVRNWIEEHLEGGEIDRIEIATNAPLSTLQAGGPPIPEDGLSIEIVTSGGTVTALDGLPPIKDADFVTRITGRTATVALGRGTVELPSGRKLTLTDGLFEIPDTWQKKPPARARLRVDGPVPAAAELLGMERLRDFSGTPLDPALSRGTVTAQVQLAFPLDGDAPRGVTTYNITTDVTNFAVDKFVMQQKVEAQSLRITANNQGYQVKGDVRIGGTPATIDYRKQRDEPDAQFRLQATLDDAARARLGYDLYGAITGPMTVRLAGKLATSPDQGSRFSVDVDLTQVKIENLLPGWVKAAGKPSRAVFTYVGREKSTRLEDMTLDGSGTLVKGTVEVDSNGDLISANLPTFTLAEGDKASLKADRTADGLLKVAMRGEVLDGRGFVKASLGGHAKDAKSRQLADIDIDVRLGAVVGFNGETIRGVEIKLLRRAGVIKNLSLNGKIGVDAPILSDLRGRSGKQVVYIETKDAGALFRFTDTYPKMMGGEMWVAMDPPTLDQAPQEGVLNVRDFRIRGEAALDQVVSGAPGGAPNGVEFTRMRVEFTRSAGRLALRDGVVRGPVVGATVEGHIDYASNDVGLTGTFVPLYGLNNAFGQIPIVGMFLGGDKEGLLGITFMVTGSPGRAKLIVNPISAVAPGLLRKFFEFQNTPSDPFRDTRSYEQRRLDPRPPQPRAQQGPDITPR